MAEAENPPSPKAPGLRRRARRMLRELGAWRLAVTIALLGLALVIARFSWYAPLTGDAERTLFDLRSSYLAERVDQDSRIMMIVYNDDTLIDTKKRSPLDRSVLARALTAIDGMGAKSIGIDILIDQPQDEDAQLVSAFRAMKTPTFLAYADFRTNEDQIRQRQQQFLDRFVTGLDGTKVTPASIRITTDVDNVARSWPFIERSLPPFLPRAMTGGGNAFADYAGSIAYRLPLLHSGDGETRPVFSSLPIDIFANADTATAFAEQVRGRHVLIGGDIVDIDQFDTPMFPATGKQMIGLEVHAHMLAQLLDGKRLPAIPGWAVWMSALLAVAAGAMTSLLQGGVRTAIFVVVQLAFFGGLPLWLHASGTDTQFLPAFGWVVGWIIAFAVMGTAAQQVGSEQRRFAQSALGKYLPRDIAKDILEEPEKLTLHGEKREIFVVFTDLEGFTALSHQIEPEMVATLLNTYLDSLCSVILKYGGTIDKFVGDAIVAFWGAPIARPDDGERAAKAAYELWEAGEAFRKNVPEGVPPIGKTRVGLHVGEAVIGNFGGEGRIQYTALGDSMNTASRLESANKKTDTCVLASGEAVARSNLDWWRPLGTVRLRGRAKPIDIFEPYPRYPGDAKKELQTAISEAVTDRTAAIARISRLAARSPKDAPLANLLNRFQNLDEGGVYALD